MSRLINADSYLKNFCNRFCSVKQCTSTQKKSCCIAISLNDEPTAFDVDKVVERLEEEKAYEDSFEDEMSCGAYNAYFNALNIVKEEGGVNE